MPLLFVLRRGGSEDGGDDLAPRILNVVVAAIAVVSALLSYAGSWTHRRQRSWSIRMFYGCAAATASSYAGLCIYRACSNIAGECFDATLLFACPIADETRHTGVLSPKRCPRLALHWQPSQCVDRLSVTLTSISPHVKPCDHLLAVFGGSPWVAIVDSVGSIFFVSWTNARETH